MCVCVCVCVCVCMQYNIYLWVWVYCMRSYVHMCLCSLVYVGAWVRVHQFSGIIIFQCTFYNIFSTSINTFNHNTDKSL